MKKNIIALVLLVAICCPTSIFAKELVYYSSLLFSLKPKNDSIIGGRGVFTVDNLGTKVTFAQGNLQYQASTNTWRFADEQWHAIGTGKYPFEGSSNNEEISSSYTGWIDLFGWGTSGYHESSDNCNLYYQPYSTSTTTQPYPCGQNSQYGYGPTSSAAAMHLLGNFALYDWGVYNSISASARTYELDEENKYNLINTISTEQTYPVATWRTPTQLEWDYVINTRRVEYGEKLGWCYVNLQANPSNTSEIFYGLLLFPDGFSLRKYQTISALNENSYGNTVTITLDTWRYLEAIGCVILPITCRRFTTTLSSEDFGYYWSSIATEDGYSASSSYACVIQRGASTANSLNPKQAIERYYGCAVRLIHVLNGTKVYD